MQKTALLVIDVQNGMFPQEDPVYNGEQLLHHIEQLITQARAKDVPIIYIQHNEPAGRQLEHGTKEWEVHTMITPEKQDVIIQKTTPDSFHQTNLEEELNKREITQLILTGIQSDLCVDTTCRRAYSLGYNVVLVSDAHSTWNGEEITAQQIINHHNSALQWFAKTKQTSEIQF